MSRPLQITIHETVSELEKLLKLTMTASKKERLQMLYWLKIGKVKTRQEVAELLHRSEATITRWLKSYRESGLTTLLEDKRAPGKKAVISTAAIAKLQERLQQPQAFKTYKEVHTWLECECGVKASYKTVHKLLRYKLKVNLVAKDYRTIKSDIKQTFPPSQ
ncbi:MAG: helix-turn-helix domain-containing protein [Calothrix sp. MO_192.B10]|nr:helix-turn-helix domain-containing protein [Calothrix sp. MO_192.B10]